VTRSLRFRLAAQVAGSITLALVLISLVSLAGARGFLDREIESSLLNVASIQASSLTEGAGGTMRFHEWDLTPEEAAQVRELNRYAQVWNAAGESLLRTQYITEDLPLDPDALSEAATGRLVTTDQRFQGLPIRSLYYPLERMGAAHARHVLQVAAPLVGRDELLRQLAWLLGAITLTVAGASFAGGWWLGGRMVRPVHEIIDQAEAMRPGTLGHRISAEAGTQEYERLVDVLNGMLARLEGAFESQRRFTADASHELRGPLTSLRGEAEVALRRERNPTEYRRVLTSNLQEVDRLTRLAEDLLTLARSDAGVMQPRLQVTDVAACAGVVMERLRTRADEKTVRLDMETTAHAEAMVDPGLIEQLLWNLVENAVKFTPAHGRVRVGVVREGRQLIIQVQDTGPGVPAEDLERIFERFYRADAARTPGGDATGTGLGLSIVRAIAEVHGGQARALNAPGGGALFRVTLPAEHAGPSAAGRQPAPED
jgi:two-component system OmpR family sensor kinase